jgi:CheY-like chemotaxis protein
METMRRILLMDDSDLALDVARDALTSAGYEVICVADLEALEEATRSPLDLVLMDVHMPDAFGDDLGMVLRSVRGVRAPIYLYSTLADPELAARAKEAELDGFISKRAGLETLLARVKEILTS